MEFLSYSLLITHIIAGSVSLILFWLPLFTKKGGINHIKIGKAYVFLMWIVIITSLILSLKNLHFGHIESAIFLGFLAILTANPVWKGIAVLNQKKGVKDSFLKRELIFEVTLCLTGTLLIINGILLKEKGILMIIFGVLGISGVGKIIARLKTKPTKINWFKEHMNNMITTGIAAYTAFFAFGGRTFFNDLFNSYWIIIPWITPTVLGIIGMRFMDKHYQKKN